MRTAEMGGGRTIHAVKAVQFGYSAPRELDALLEVFRLMCNDAIRLAVDQKPRNRFVLQEIAYARLKEYGLHSHYINSACEVAYSVYRNKNRRVNPSIRRAFLKLDNLTYTLNHLIVRIPTQPRRFIYLTLRGSDYHLALIHNSTFKRGSVTITDRTVSIALSQRVAAIEPLGMAGVDVNERNVTVCETQGTSRAYDISRVQEVKEIYRAIRARIGERIGKDRRVAQSLYAKYGRREKNRTKQEIHRVSKAIVKSAKAKGLGIVMEDLNGIRKLYRRGNGQGASFRGRMNTWAFNEIQTQIEYKSKWLGIPVYYVNPRGTSRKCPNCGSRVVHLQERKLFCPECDITWDRDVLASTNLMACVVPQVRPLRGSGEKGRDDDSNPSSRREEVSETDSA
jgi:putative transposase